MLDFMGFGTGKLIGIAVWLIPLMVVPGYLATRTFALILISFGFNLLTKEFPLRKLEAQKDQNGRTIMNKSLNSTLVKLGRSIQLSCANIRLSHNTSSG